MGVHEQRLIENQRVSPNIKKAKRNQRDKTTNRDSTFFEFAEHG